MILATVNSPRRLLHMSFVGHVTPDDFRIPKEDIRILLGELTTGFRLLSDLERLESMDDACAGEIGRMMEIFSQKGVDLVVRIIPSPQKDIGLQILSAFHYGNRMRTVTCANMVEAMRLLKF